MQNSFVADNIVWDYFPFFKYLWDKRAKSLICFGAHADRKQVEKQARENGLKVIYIDPECFYNKTFEPYPIEGPKDNDIILRMKFEDIMELFKKELIFNTKK